MAKKAFITGVTGQDGSYLAEFLLEKGYEVYGMQRRASTPNTARIDHLYENKNFFTVYGDLSDGSNLFRIINKIQPDEIYNLAAQSHVGISFEKPEYTNDINAAGPLRILEVIRNLKLPSKFYQASSSEMFGDSLPPQNESTPFRPCSPYGVSKASAYGTTKIFRDAYEIFASNGILFNHESPRRGFNFVTRKITLGLSRIKLGLQETLKLGNLDAKRDWGYAKDYVEAIWKVLQHNVPDDFVIATGKAYSVRDFVEEAAKHLGMEIIWQGKGLEERGVDRKTGKTIVAVDPAYFRPKEVHNLIGDASRAKEILGWQPKVTFKELVEIMVKSDLDYVEKGGITARIDASPNKFLAE